MILVAFGIFSVMAYTVSLQTRNIGIRMALGADRAHIIRRVLNSGLALISLGTIVGTLTALALTRLIASHIWGVSTQDPLTFSAASVLMLVIGLLGSLFPARRASQVDPMVVLRHE
jgi:putative ABC transport system permease protein